MGRPQAGARAQLQGLQRLWGCWLRPPLLLLLATADAVAAQQAPASDPTNESVDTASSQKQASAARDSRPRPQDSSAAGLKLDLEHCLPAPGNVRHQALVDKRRAASCARISSQTPVRVGVGVGVRVGVGVGVRGRGRGEGWGRGRSQSQGRGQGRGMRRGRGGNVFMQAPYIYVVVAMCSQVGVAQLAARRSHHPKVASSILTTHSLLGACAMRLSLQINAASSALALCGQLSRGCWVAVPLRSHTGGPLQVQQSRA